MLIPHLQPVVLTLYGVDGRARLGLKVSIKLAVLAKPTRVTQEGILLVVVDGPTLVALVDVLPTGATDTRMRGDRRLAPRTLEHLRTSLDG